MDPHFPYQPPPEERERFAPQGTPDYDALFARYAGGEITRGELAVRVSPSAAALAQGAALYDGEIAAADRGVGRVVDAVAGGGRPTFVVVTSDHGESLGEHGVNFAHTFTTWEPMMRVPLVFAGVEGIPRGTRVKEQAELLDVAPTVLEVAGIATPAPMRGRSLLPSPRSSLAEGGPRYAYGENAPLLPGHSSATLIEDFDEIYLPGMEGKWRMVRDWPWKLVHIPGRPGGEDLLFDLEHDPGESKDLSASEPDTLARFRAALDGFLAEDREHAAPEILPVDAETERRLRSLGYVQ